MRHFRTPISIHPVILFPLFASQILDFGFPGLETGLVFSEGAGTGRVGRVPGAEIVDGEDVEGVVVEIGVVRVGSGGWVFGVWDGDVLGGEGGKFENGGALEGEVVVFAFVDFLGRRLEWHGVWICG